MLLTVSCLKCLKLAVLLFIEKQIEADGTKRKNHHFSKQKPKVPGKIPVLEAEVQCYVKITQRIL